MKFPKGGKQTRIPDITGRLKPMLSHFEGFISIERFESLQTPGKILALSFGENENSIRQWRNETMHRQGQANGLDHIFSD